MEKDLILSLGSNIEPRVDYLKETVTLLGRFFSLARLSSIYRTAAQEDEDQADFYNLCAVFKTGRTDPFEILAITQFIEKKMGRVKDQSRPKGPRKIDIDILIYHQTCIGSRELTIPHPKMLHRNFVLIPLVEILLNYNDKYIEQFDMKKKIILNQEQRVVPIGELSFE